MNVGEFKKWLNQFDDDTIVECVVHHSGHGYYDQGGTARVVEFEPDMVGTNMNESGGLFCFNGHMDYTDLTNNQFVKPSSEYYGKKILSIGSIGN